MRNAQKNALMAIFAAMEENAEAARAAEARTAAPEPRRPILVDLALLAAQRHVKKVA